MSKVNLGLVAIASALCIVGCMPERSEPQMERVIQSATQEEVIARINSSAESVSSFKAKATMYGTFPDYGENQRFKGPIFFQRPNRIRLKASVVVMELFDIVSDGDNYFFHDQRDRIVYRGSFLEKTPEEKAAGLSARDIIDALVPGPIAPGVNVRIVDFREFPAAYALRLADISEKGREREIWVDRVDLRAVRQRYFSRKGRLILDVSYSHHDMFDGVAFPRKLIYRWPGIEKEGQPPFSVRLAINLDTIELNPDPTINPKVFQFRIPPTARLVELSSQ